MPTHGGLSRAAWRELLTQHDHRCVYCGHPGARFNELSVDHKTPLSRGGSLAWDNLTVACQRCNAKKGKRTVEEYLAGVPRWAIPKLT